MNMLNSFYKIVAKEIQFFRMKKAKVMDMEVKDYYKITFLTRIRMRLCLCSDNWVDGQL